MIEENYDEIDRRLKELGLELERRYVELSKDEVEELWLSIRKGMDSPRWELYRYWEFIYETDLIPEDVIRHDVWCVENAKRRSFDLREDDLGPRVMFITADSRKLLRLRKDFPFILSPVQFEEFIFPYLFLSDIPVLDADKFPNQLLSAQLGLLLVKRPPRVTEITLAYLKNPAAFDEPFRGHVPLGADIGRVFSTQRFQSLCKECEGLDEATKEKVAQRIDPIVEEWLRTSREGYYTKQGAEAELGRLRGELSVAERKIEKLRGTVRYLKQQRARRG